MTIKVSLLRSIPRIILFLLLNALLLPAYALCGGPLGRWKRPIQVGWACGVRRLTGLRVRTFGTPHRGGTTLFASNHVSYLDIPVVSELVEGTFVAKSEIGSWPLFGQIAKLTRTVLVKREGREVGAQLDEMRSRLISGENLILFPEGSTTDGSGVAPFKSSLFGVIEGLPQDSDIVIQPMSIAYPRYADGTPLVGSLRSLYCWFGDATLVPHLVRVFGLKGAEVEVRFHAPMPVGEFSDRKDLARHCHAMAAGGVAESQAGGGETKIPG